MKPFMTAVFTILFVMQALTLLPDKNDNNDSIILPATYGWTSNGETFVALHAWTFEFNNRSLLGKGFTEFMNEIFEDAGDAEKRILNERIRYFVADNKGNKTITVNISGERFSLPETSPNGHVFSIVKLGNVVKKDPAGSSRGFQTLPVTIDGGPFSGTANIIGETGYSVISDIDDTIKASDVLNKKELLKNLFIRKPVAVNGMPELYRRLEKMGCAFHYVSGSPWQLYPSIQSFLTDEKFPEGSIDLKMFRIKDKSFIGFVTADQVSYKLKAISTIIERFPGRKFILIGDSSEKDPEIYLKLAKQYGNRIRQIFIRNAGRIEPDSPRRKKIIEEAADTELVIFDEPSGLVSYISEL